MRLKAEDVLRLTLRGPIATQMDVFAFDDNPSLAGGLVKAIGGDVTWFSGHDAAPFVP